MAMTSLVASASQADAATTVSSAVAFLPNLTVECSAANGAGVPTTPCKVVLQLSIDGVNYVDVDHRWFGAQASQTYWQAFMLADYVGAQQFRGSDFLNRANPANTVNWANFKVKFYNNTGAAVQVFAQYG